MRAAGEQIVDQAAELGLVAAGDVLACRRRPRVSCVGRRRELPVGVLVAVQVVDLQRSAGGVDPDPAELLRRQQAVDHTRHRVALEDHRRHRDVLELDRTIQPYGGGVDRAPRSEQVQQQVDLVDAVAQRRPTTLTDPRPAPLRVEVRSRPEPQRLADRDLRSTQGAAGQELGGAHRPGSVPVLEDDVHRASAGRLGLGHRVQLGQAQHRRLLQQHGLPGGQDLDRDLGVAARRCRHRDQVGIGRGQQFRHALERLRPVLVGECLRVLGDEVGDADERRTACAREGLGVPATDAAGTDHRDLQDGCHWAAPRTAAFCCAVSASRMVSKVCSCGAAVVVRSRTSRTRSG